MKNRLVGLILQKNNQEKERYIEVAERIAHENNYGLVIGYSEDGNDTKTLVQEGHQKIVCIVNKSQIGLLKDYKLAKKKGANHGFQILQIRNFHPGNTSSGSPENPPGSRCRTHRELRFLYVIK